MFVEGKEALLPSRMKPDILKVSISKEENIMKRILFLLTALLLIAAGPSISRASGEGEQKNAPEASQKKEQYEKSMEERLKNLGKQLDELNAKAAQRTEEVKKELGQYLKDAEKKQQAASQKLEEVKKASAEKWRKFTSDMNKAADEFEKAFERAKKNFKE